MRRWAEPATFLASAALHGLLLGVLVSSPARRGSSEPVEIQIVEKSPPPPAAEPPAPPPPPEPRPAPPRRRLAVAPAPKAPPAREPPAPPPPNTPAPPDAPRGPVRIGVSMSATTEAGGVATAVGNTLYGRMPDRAPEGPPPGSYRADHYAPPTEVTTLPEPVATEIPKSEYPEEARRLGFEGAVRLLLLIDVQGRVRKASIIVDPGHGLGPAAVRDVQRYFRFRPGRRAGEPVATEIPFTLRYELP